MQSQLLTPHHGQGPAAEELSSAGTWFVRLERGTSDQSDTLVRGSRGALRLLSESGRPGPQVAVSGARAAVVWGSVDNGSDLARELRVADTTDVASLALAVFNRYGAELPALMHGRFIAIVYDADRDLFMATRDRVGFVPLFIRTRSAGLDVAVVADAFALDLAAGPKVNLQLAAAYLAGVRMDLEETFLAGVERVPPGHKLLIDGGVSTLARHWLPPPVGAGAEWVTEQELPRFGGLLEQAVAKPLTKGRAAIFLSGGLDSVSVAAAAVDHCRRNGYEPPIALSLIFPGEVSEESVQRGVASSLGMDFLPLRFEDALAGKGLLAAGLELSAKLSTPLQNVWTPAYDALTARGTELGASQVLTGGGGDEWLTVTPVIAADYIARGEFGALFSYLGALTRSLPHAKRDLWRNVLWTHGSRPLLSAGVRNLRTKLMPGVVAARRKREKEAALAGLPDWVAPDAELKAALKARVGKRFEVPTGPTALGIGGRYFREMAVTLNHPLLALDIEEIFEDGRRNSAQHWDIYWDADLIEFLYRVPPSLLNRGGRSKGMVRDDVARRFPELGFAQQKKLISRDFFTETFFGEVESAWTLLGGVPALSDVGLVEPSLVPAPTVRGGLVPDVHTVDKIWRLMSLEAWLRPRL